MLKPLLTTYLLIYFQIGTVSAEDKDSALYNVFGYSFVSGASNDAFAIDASSGVLSTRKTLDRETQGLHQFTVAAYDRKLTSMSSTAAVSVQVSGGHRGQMGFAIEADIPKFPRALNIFYWRWISFYMIMTCFFPVNIRCKVSAAMFFGHNVYKCHVQVLDRNDNSPDFRFPGRFNNTIHVSNRVPVGRVIAQLSARDADIDQNARVSYQLTQMSPDSISPSVQGEQPRAADFFKVDADRGLVTITSRLSAIDFRVFALNVTARDHGVPSRSGDASHLYALHFVAPSCIRVVW